MAARKTKSKKPPAKVAIPNEPHFDLALAIRMGMARKGWKGTDLRQKVKVTSGALTGWLNGDKSPSLVNLKALAAAFDIKLSEFVRLGETS